MSPEPLAVKDFGEEIMQLYLFAARFVGRSWRCDSRARLGVVL